MEAKTKLSAKLKQEVLMAIKKIDLEFEQLFEGDRNASAIFEKEIETKNFNIVIELAENVKFTAIDEYDFDSLEVLNFSVIDENSIDYEDEFTDEEIINAINY
jgi:hypothetical protein